MENLVKVCLCFVLVIGLALTAQAQPSECLDYTEFTHFPTEIEIPEGAAYNILVDGDYTFVFGQLGMLVYDLSDPALPTLVGSLETPEISGVSRPNLAIAGDHLYVAESCGLDNGHLLVLNVADPNSPFLETTIDLPCVDVVVQGGLAFVLTYDSFRVYDVSLPENLQELAVVENLNNPKSLTAVGNYVYVNLFSSFPGYGGTLQVVDVSNPEMPVLGNAINVWVDVFDWEISGTTLLGSGCNSYGQLACLQVFDISDPGTPVSPGPESTVFYENASIPGAPLSLCLDGNFAYIADANYFGIYKFDISDPLAPFKVGRYSTAGLPPLGMDVSNNNIFTACTSSLQIIEIVPLETLPSAGLVEFSDLSINKIKVEGSHAFGSGSSGTHPDPVVQWFWVMNMEDPANPQLAGSVELPDDNLKNFLISGEKVYAILNNYDSQTLFSLHLLNVSDPNSPEFISTVQLPCNNSNGAMASWGEFVYLAVEDYLVIVDATNPLSLEVVGLLDYPGSAIKDLAIRENSLFLVLNNAVQVFDLSVPDSPVWISTFESSYDPAVRPLGMISIADDKAYLNFAEYEFSEYVCGAGVGPLFNYILGEVQVLDISNPAEIQLMGQVEVPGFSQKRISIRDDVAYLPLWQGGMATVDVSDPQQPTFIGTVLSGGFGYPGNIAIGEQFGYIPRRSEGLELFYLHCDETVGITNPPHEETQDTPELLNHLSIHPNPFNPQTTISFTASRSQNIEISIFDLTGRRIAILANRTFEAGVHSIDWAGRDFQGRAVASGSYLVRMEDDQEIVMKKMTLVR